MGVALAGLNHSFSWVFEKLRIETGRGLRCEQSHRSNGVRTGGFSNSTGRAGTPSPDLTREMGSDQ